MGLPGKSPTTLPTTTISPRRASTLRGHRVSIFRLRLLVPSLDGGGAIERPAFITHDTVGREAPSEGARVTSQVGGEVVRDRLWKREHDSRIGITLPRWQARTRK